MPWLSNIIDKTKFQSSESISGSVTDLYNTAENMNLVKDFFDFASLAAGDDGKFLKYDHTSGTVVVDTVTPGSGITDVVDDTSPQLGNDLQVNDFDIINSDGSNRGDCFLIGGQTSVNTSTSQLVSIPSGFDAGGGGGDRLAGPIELCVVDDMNTWNERVHSLAALTRIGLTADLNSNGSSRIRNRYTELQMDLTSFDFNPSGDRFGDGLIGQFISSKAFNSTASTTSTIRSLTGLSIHPQTDGNTGNTNVTNMRGTLVQPFVDANGTVTNFYGYIYTHGSPSTVTGSISNEYSFYSDVSSATFKNDGPVQLSGLSYPTSDGTSGQALTTNGSGTLSFTDVASTGLSGGSVYNGGTIGDTDNISPDYSNGSIQRYTLTASSAAPASTTLNVPTNMSDGDFMYLIFEVDAGTVGENAEVTYATGTGFYATSTGFGESYGDAGIVKIIRSGSRYYIATEGVAMINMSAL